MEKKEIDIDHLIRSMPKPTEAEQIELDLLAEQVAERMRYNRFHDLLTAAKIIGDKLKGHTKRGVK